MNEKEVAETILEKGVDFTVMVTNTNFLHRLGLIPKERTFTIRPIRLGALIQIAKEISGIGVDQLEKLMGGSEASLFGSGIEMIIEYKDNMVRAIAYAIENDKHEPPASLIRFLDNNLTPRELLKLLLLVIRQMDVTDFLACMVSAAGRINLLKAGTENIKEKDEKTSGVLSEG